MASKPTQRTMNELRKLGFTAHIVEKTVPRVRVKIDMFNFADIVAMRPGVGIIAIQATDGTSHSKRRAKLLAEPRVRTWIESGGRAELWSWSKRVRYLADGRKAKLPAWTLRREEIAAADVVTA